MFNIKERPHRLLLFTAIGLLLSLVLPPIAHLDFQGKTMFSVPLATMVWIIPVLLISLWLLYVLTSRFLYSVTITWIHIFVTVFATILIMAVLYIGINPSQFRNDRHELIGNAIQNLAILFVCGQFAYLANVLLGLLYKTNKQ